MLMRLALLFLVKVQSLADRAAASKLFGPKLTLSALPVNTILSWPVIISG